MPEFSTPFAGNNIDRKLTKYELIRALRYNAAAEFEAVQLYMQLYDSTDDETAKKVLYQIANEEKIHAGEFLHLINQLDPKEEKFYQEGERKVNMLIDLVKEQ